MSKTFWIIFGILFGVIALIIIVLVFVSTEAEKPMTAQTETAEEGVELTKAKDEYIQITIESAPIYFENNEQSTLITKAQKGDIFELIGEKDGWYEISMLCGEYRYIQEAQAEIIEFIPSLPEEKIARAMWDEFGKAEDKSVIEADKKYPPDKDLYENIDYGRILEDKYKLEIFHKYNVQPASYMKILTEGAEKRW